MYLSLVWRCRRRFLLTVGLAMSVGAVACSGSAARTGESSVDAGDAATSVDADASDVSDASDAGIAGIDLWPQPDQLELHGPFYEAHPGAFAHISRWTTHLVAPEHHKPGDVGALGTGNGHVFGFTGYARPLNTLHSLVGPTYERGDCFFGDYRLDLDVDGAKADFDEQWATRSLSAPVMITRARAGDLELDTVDFAPRGAGAGAAKRCMVRVVLVRNNAAQPSAPVQLAVRSHNHTDPVGADRLVEVEGERALVTGFADDGGATAVSAHAKKLDATLGPIDAGAERQLVLAFCTQQGTSPKPLPAIDAGALLDQTGQSYRAWRDGLVHFDVPDPMVADLLDGLIQTLEVQMSAQGASCPMSQYTRTWTRDNIGPTLGFLSVGAFDKVASMLDYLYGAIRLNGSLGNSYDADLDLSDLPAPPDWANMAPLSGREGAETPSYLVWMYGAQYDYTGDVSRATERFGLLRYALLEQAFGPDGLLPFTGDETFRAAMNGAFDMALDYAHSEKSWSANSSLLWLGAYARFAELAGAIGSSEADQALAEATTRRDQVEQSVRDHYLLDDGCISPFLDRSEMTAYPAPFEDVALKVTWAGWLDGDAPLARDALGCLIDHSGLRPGVVQSPTAARFAPMLGGTDGVYTGMLPGYTLSALTAAGHPQAADAFRELGVAASTTGNYQEYQKRATDTGLELVYNADGRIGDYTAKFRPWEGGINLAAAMDYLTGFRPHAADHRLELRPHLPAGWPRMGLTGLRTGDGRFDLHMSRDADAITVTLTSHADVAYTVALRWDAASAPAHVAVDGAQLDPGQLDPDQLDTVEQFGAVSTALPPVQLDAGQSLVFRIR